MYNRRSRNRLKLYRHNNNDILYHIIIYNIILNAFCWPRGQSMSIYYLVLRSFALVNIKIPRHLLHVTTLQENSGSVYYKLQSALSCKLVFNKSVRTLYIYTCVRGREQTA